MAQSRSNSVYLLILLAAILAFGATHRAQACPQGMADSEHRSCCDGMGQAAMDEPGIQHQVVARFDCPMVRGRFLCCSSAGHCTCAQSVHAAQVTAREVRPAILAPSPLPVWPGSPISEGRIPLPQGPPDTGSADPPGRHAYLATLRLRI